MVQSLGSFFIQGSFVMLACFSQVQTDPSHTEGDDDDRPSASEIRSGYLEISDDQSYQETHELTYDEDFVTVKDNAVISGERKVLIILI